MSASPTAAVAPPQDRTAKAAAPRDRVVNVARRDRTAEAAPPSRFGKSPRLLSFGAGLVVIAAIMVWVRPTARVTPDPASIRPQAPVIDAAAVQRARDREAAARAEQQRLAAEEAAERARIALAQADAASEAQARAEREERNRKRVAEESAQREAVDSEEAWKRFYKPSAGCKDPSAAASVECANEYVRARRAFGARSVADSSR